MNVSVLENSIPVAVAANQRYYPGLFVTCASIAMYASRDVNLTFVVLDSGISDVSFNELTLNVGSLHPHVNFQRVIVNEQLFSGFPKWRGNYATFLRFLLPRVMKDSEFVIYADADTMWCADIAVLWGMRDWRFVLQGCLDKFAEHSESEWFVRHGLIYRADRYVNAGMLILNLAKIRAELVVERATQFLVSHPDILYPDQTALNAVLKPDEMGVLPANWNVFSGCLTSKHLEGMVVVHFANELPWLASCWFSAITDSMLLWHRCNAKTRSCSVLGSLRMSFLPLEIVRMRMQFLIAVWPVTRWLYYLLIRFTPASLKLEQRSRDWYRRLDWPAQL